MLKKLLFGKNYKRYLNQSLVKENYKRAKYFSIIIFILEACFLVASFLLMNFFSQDLISVYRMHYLVLLVSSGLFFLVINILSRRGEYTIVGKMILYTALTFAIAWGASLSLIDIIDQLGITVYMTFVFISSFAILSRPDISAIILLLIQVGFCYSMPDVSSRVSYQINSSVFVVFAWFVGRYHYILVNERLLKDELIKEKNKVLENQNTELARLMMTDHLTGIYNRYSLDDILAKKWMESYIHQVPITCFMIDVDDFKKFNDRYGHIQGDKCIQEVSRILKEVSDKEHGYAFRYGGDEFCLILTDIKYPEELIKEINYLTDRFKLKVEGREISLSLSIGMYHGIPQKSDDEWSCIEGADQSLYTKKSKRNRRSTDELA